MTTVLIVDDSAVARAIASGILESVGVSVVCAADGREALGLIAAARPDVVLSDLQMPGMDGLELVREIKQDFPSIPVILVTGAGSEEIAVEALRIGASSYVTKRNLQRDLERVLETVLASVATQRERERVHKLLQHSENYYVLDYEPGADAALINYLLDSMAQAKIGDEADWQRVGMALAEALANATDHGNLELDSGLREASEDAYGTIRCERICDPRYRDRRVHVTARMTRAEARFTIRDEGPGFDPNALPDPTDPENLTKAGGRGVLLIRTFMDEVSFNSAGNEITMVKLNSSLA